MIIKKRFSIYGDNMDYTIEPKLKQLDSKIQATESRLAEDFKKRESSMLSTISTIKADIIKNIKD